jgi:hypothetical protein
MKIRLFSSEDTRASLAEVLKLLNGDRLLPLVDTVYSDIDDEEGSLAAKEWLSQLECLSESNKALAGKYLLFRVQAEDKLVLEVKEHIKELAMALRDGNNESNTRSRVMTFSFQTYLHLLHIDIPRNGETSYKAALDPVIKNLEASHYDGLIKEKLKGFLSVKQTFELVCGNELA